MFFSVQLLVEKVFNLNEIKETHIIQAQGPQEIIIVFLAQLLKDKKSLKYCATQR